MKWLHAPIGMVAPAQTSSKRPPPGSEVWQLSLDQIESDTGRIVDKKTGPVDLAGPSTYFFDSGNVLYSKLRPYLNKVVCPNEVGIASTELVPLRPREKLLDRRYLTYYLRSPGFVNFATVTVAGVKMPRIIMNKFWNHQIPLPTLSEQRRIVEILDQADVLRQQRRAADEKAKRILPALFYHMFGDPTTNPMGWPTRKFSELFSQEKTAIDGSAGKELPYLGLEHIESDTGRILCSEAEALAVKVRGLSFCFGPQHVLYGKLRPYLNKVALPSFEGRCSTELVPLLPALGVSREFLASYLRLPYVVNAAVATSKGARMPRTDMDLLMAMEVPIPYKECQRAFAITCATALNTIEKNCDASHSLEDISSILLHRAFTGELTAKWREACKEELKAEMEDQNKALAELASRSSGHNRKRSALS